MMKATAAPAHFPYTDHRTMEQVFAEETDYERAVAHHCPRCGAVPGVRCDYNPNGSRQNRNGMLHLERRRLASAAEARG